MMTRQPLNLPREYLPPLERVTSFIDADAWLVGGWVLSYVLGKAYAGDIDILTESPLDRMVRSLTAAGILVTQSARGSLRIKLPDDNHIDISSTSSFANAKNIETALKRYHFSALSMAFNLRSGDIYQTADCKQHLNKGHFVINEEYQNNGNDMLSLCREFEKLTTFYKLTPGKSRRQCDFESRHNQLKEYIGNLPTEQALRWIARMVHPLTPPHTKSWLTRGALRCAIMQSLTIWDDIDVIFQCDMDTLLTHLESINARYHMNFHGTPKVILDNGQHIDIITVCSIDSLHSLLASFAHSVDAIAYSLDDDEFLDPIGAYSDINSRRLRMPLHYLTLYNDSDYRYHSIKCAYLQARHSLIPCADAETLMATPFFFTGFDKRNACKLAQQLDAIGFNRKYLNIYPEPPSKGNELSAQLIQRML